MVLSRRVVRVGISRRVAQVVLSRRVVRVGISRRVAQVVLL